MTSMTSEPLISDATDAASAASSRRVGRTAAAASLIAALNVGVAVSAESLMCVPDQYVADDWALWVWGALAALVVGLGATAVVRGQTRWLGAVALVAGLLQVWWLLYDLAFWACPA